MSSHAISRLAWCLLPIVPLLLAITCESAPPLLPAPGMPAWREATLVPVPGGRVDVAGGNLVVTRSELSLDTLLGPLEIEAHWNAATGAWRWSLDVSFDGATFVDATGTVHDLFAHAFGDPVGGTVWSVVDADSLRTRGGLAHVFDGAGRLQHVGWSTLPWPRLEHTASEVRQCVAAGVCTPLVTITRDAQGRPLSIEDARAGHRVSYAWDAAGRLVAALGAVAAASGAPGTSYSYASGDTLLTSVVQPEGERVDYAYDASRRLVAVAEAGPGTPTHAFAYGARGPDLLFPTLHTDPMGARTRYRIDGKRRLRVRERLETGETETIAWSGRRPVGQTSAAGVTTELQWIDDELAVRTTASGNTVRFTYAPGALHHEAPTAAALLRVEDDLGLVEARSYDAYGRLAALENGAGDTTSFTYTAGTSVASVTDAAGRVHDFAGHGTHGLWRTRQGPVPDQRAFDLAGNAVVASAASAPGGWLVRGFGPDRLLARLELGATDVDGAITSVAAVDITRRSDGQLLAITRPNGGDHAFVYDAFGRIGALRERVDGVWQVTSFERDLAGRITVRERSNGMREEIAYDAYGRPVGYRILRDGLLEGALTLTLADGRVVSVHDSIRGTTETRAYDGAGRLSAIAYGHGETLVRGYDLRSRLVRETYAVAGLGVVADVGRAYDGVGRELQLVDHVAGAVLVLRSFESGRLARVTTGNGLSRTRLYDADGRTIATETRDAAGVVVERTDLAYTLEGAPPRQQTRIVTTTPLATTEEQYWLGIGASLAAPEQYVGKRVFGWSDGTQVRRHAYDALGNRTDPGSGDAFVYNGERNRLLQVTLVATGETIAYTWDASGFATSRGGVPIGWTADGRLASIGADTLSWDLRGGLVSRQSSGVVRRYEWFGGRVEGDAGAGTLGALDLGPVALDLATPARRYRHPDLRGHVSFESDEAGAVVTHRHYAAYGEIAAYGDAMGGRGWDAHAALGDLVLSGLRPYDPAVGRFLAPDPLIQWTSQHTYTSGNPLWYGDVTGAQEAPRVSVKNVVSGVGTGAVLVAASTARISPQTSLIAATVAGLAAFTLFGIDAIESDQADRNAVPPCTCFSSPGLSMGGCSPLTLARTPDLGSWLGPLLALNAMFAAIHWVRRPRRITP